MVPSGDQRGSVLRQREKERLVTGTAGNGGGKRLRKRGIKENRNQKRKSGPVTVNVTTTLKVGEGGVTGGSLSGGHYPFESESGGIPTDYLIKEGQQKTKNREETRTSVFNCESRWEERRNSPC